MHPNIETLLMLIKFHNSPAENCFQFEEYVLAKTKMDDSVLNIGENKYAEINTSEVVIFLKCISWKSRHTVPLKTERIKDK